LLLLKKRALLPSLCLDGRLLKSGGIGTYIQQLILALHEQTKLTVLCYAKDREWFKEYPRVALVDCHSPIYSIREQFELRRKIPSCDIFFSPHFNIPLFPIRAQKRITCIQDVYHLAHSLPLLQTMYAQLFYNAALRVSDVIVTPSQFSKNELLRLATLRPKRDISVIPHALCSRYFYTCSTQIQMDEYILVVGNVKPHKNLKRLFKAFAQLNRPEMLLVVGRRENFITKEEGLEMPSKQVCFTGYIEDSSLHALYAHAKLLIFPSLYEGFGFPPLEAMAMGCPVVASTAGSIPEICKQGAYYVNALSEESLAQGIELCLTDEQLRKNLIEKGKEVAYTYPFETFKESYLRIVQENSYCS
jgi:glycosyltransferase involved in cell wall biosynthesis